MKVHLVVHEAYEAPAAIATWAADRGNHGCGQGRCLIRADPPAKREDMSMSSAAVRTSGSGWARRLRTWARHGAGHPNLLPWLAMDAASSPAHRRGSLASAVSAV
jgi:hypothetical protein